MDKAFDKKCRRILTADKECTRTCQVKTEVRFMLYPKGMVTKNKKTKKKTKLYKVLFSLPLSKMSKLHLFEILFRTLHIRNKHLAKNKDGEINKHFISTNLSTWNINFPDQK